MRFQGLAGAFLVAVCIASACAQSDIGGSVSGHVAGSGGTPVRGARIALVDAVTGESTAAASDARGDFHFADVAPGEYRLVVQSPELSDWEADNLTVGVGTAMRFHAALTSRLLHRTILVDARRAEEISGDADEIGTAWLDELPNNGQRVSALASVFGAGSPDGNGGLSFQGLSPMMNAIALDGASNVLAFRASERGSAGEGFAMGQSTVAGFRAGNYGASGGSSRAPGGRLNAVTKGGSNHMHGQATFYDRGAIGQAFNAFANTMEVEPAGSTRTATGQPVQYWNGEPVTYVQVPVHSPDRRQQWEIAAGGPMRRDRAFWFFSWEQHERHDPAIARAAEPQIFFFPASEPSLTTLQARLARATVTSPLVRGCPAAVQDSTAAAACAYSAVLHQLSAILGSVPRSTRQTNLFPRIDWRIGSRSQLSVEYSSMRRTAPHGALGGASEFDGIGSFGDSSTSDDAAVARWDFFARPHLLSSARAELSRDVLAQRPGTETAFERQLANNAWGLPPQISIDRTSGFTFGTLSTANKTEYPAETRRQAMDAATWIHGREAIRFGYDYSHVRDELNGLNGENGEYSYANVIDFVSDLLAPDSCGAGDDGAGPYPCYSTYRQTLGSPTWWFTTEDYATWLADEWQAAPRLTLTFGVRWQYERLPDTNAALVNADIPQTARLPHNRDEFSPRGAFSWDVFGRGRSVLRGSFAVEYARIPNATVFSALTTTGSAHSPRSYRWRSTDVGAPPFPYVFSSSETPYTDPAAPDQASTAPDATYFDRRFRAPQIDEADLEWQQSLGARMSLTIAGMATDGHHLAQLLDTNIDTADVATVFYSVKGPDNLSDAGPLGQRVGQAAGAAFPIYALTRDFYYRRRNPAYGSTMDMLSEGNSSYRALTARLVRRISAAASINAGYTWAHAIDDNQSDSAFAARSTVYDPADPRLDHGTSDFDIRQRISGAVALREPWRPRGVAGFWLGGYRLAATGQWRTGLPYSMRAAGAIPSPSCSYEDWLAAGGAAGNGADCLKAVQQPNVTFDAGSTPVPIPGVASGVNGSGGDNFLLPIGRNTYRYPHAAGLDVRLTKRIRLSDRYSFDLMGEAFNVLNHENVTAIQTIGYRIVNDEQHANMASLVWQSGMKPGESALMVNGTSVSQPVFDSTAAFGDRTNANSRSLNRERQIQAGIRLRF